MLPVLHYSWKAFTTFFISSLVACDKWLEKKLIYLLIIAPFAAVVSTF